MKNILKKIFSHKIFLIIFILIIAVGGYFAWQKLRNNKETETQYISSVVEKGSITVSVSGTGQVSVSNQVDIEPQVSGQVIYLNIANGQEVKDGTLLVQLDATDVLQTVRDAQDNLETAKLSLEKLMAPTDELTITKAENSLTQTKENKENYEDNLIKSYDDGFNNVADAFLDMPTIMAGLNGIIYGYNLSNIQWNIHYYETRTKQCLGSSNQNKVDQYVDKALSSYQKARDNYDKNLEDYKNSSRYSEEQVIEDLIGQIYDTLKDISEAIKDTKNLIDFFEDTLTKKNLTLPAYTSTHQSSLQGYTGIINGHLSSMLSDKNTIDDTKQNIISAQRSIEEKEGDLVELSTDPDALDVRSQELTIRQRENSLLNAQQKLSDYYVRAPFDGIIAETEVQKGETLSSGSIVATLITAQKIAEITLNEIDVAQIEVGQKAILEFDAVQNLSITGEIVEIDTLGAVSSGVVSYGVKITFDVQDERIKPGMSLSTNIIIESKRNVLVIPSSAVKNIGDSSYVEVLVNNQPQSKTITTGLGDDFNVEVVDGLQEGDQIITQTINGSSSKTSIQSAQPSGNNDAMKSMMRMTR